MKKSEAKLLKSYYDLKKNKPYIVENYQPINGAWKPVLGLVTSYEGMSRIISNVLRNGSQEERELVADLILEMKNEVYTQDYIYFIYKTN